MNPATKVYDRARPSGGEEAPKVGDVWLERREGVDSFRGGTLLVEAREQPPGGVNLAGLADRESAGYGDGKTHYRHYTLLTDEEWTAALLATPQGTHHFRCSRDGCHRDCPTLAKGNAALARTSLSLTLPLRRAEAPEMGARPKASPVPVALEAYALQVFVDVRAVSPEAAVAVVLDLLHGESRVVSFTAENMGTSEEVNRV